MPNLEKTQICELKDLLESLSTWKKWNKLIQEISTQEGEQTIENEKKQLNIPKKVESILEL